MDELSKGTLDIPFEVSKVLIYLLALSMPWSIEWGMDNFNINVISEIVLVMAFISLMLQFKYWEFIRNELMGNRISKLIALFWLIMAISILFSSFPIVSTKYTFISGLSIMVYYFGVSYHATKDQNAFNKVFLIYLVSFLPLVIYSWINHYQYDFRMDVSVMVSRPFIKNHAVYSACVIMLFFATIGLKYPGEKRKLNGVVKLIVLICLLLALYLSFSRAAWITFLILIVFFGLASILKMSVARWCFAIISVILLAGSFTYWILNNNFTYESISKSGSPQEHLSSSLNVKTDVSNLERINRYKCALRMVRDKPIIGFGAGTYQFAYLEYQRKEDMTRLSVVKPDNDGLPHDSGRGGEAHSEYLGNLAELGILGFLSWMALLVVALFSGLKNVIERNIEKRKSIFQLAILCLVSGFCLLSLVNDFWQVEEVLFLFMCGLAVISRDGS